MNSTLSRTEVKEAPPSHQTMHGSSGSVEVFTLTFLTKFPIRAANLPRRSRN